jgi:hypothetical protein
VYGRLPLRSSILVRLLVLVLALPLVAVVCTHGLTGTAAAAAHSGPKRLVASPTGQSVRGDQVRIVVRAGPEHGDLKAWLNGVSIGRRFKVREGARQRVLEASPIDGLRRGRNVLRVQAVAKRGGYRRATVHFEIRHRRPLGSAGIDRRVVVGSRVELQGLLRLDKSDSGRKSLRWDVVKAPAESALSAPKGSAVASAAQTALGERHTLSPTFRPDVPGRYQVQMTASGGNGKTVDIATIYAVPPNPLITLKTSVPATGQEPQPGIQVGGEVLRAPYMRVNGKQGSYAGSVEGVNYTAMWQVVAYDRVTMALKWNRTYGICSGHAALYPCMVGKNGNPTGVNLGGELAALGQESLVIVASHPSGATPALAWDPPDEYGYLSTSLTGIGMPTEAAAEFAPQLAAAKAGEMAGVGVPGLAAGEAKFIIGGEQTGLNGYLTPDSNAPKHYFYVPSERQPFDTRLEDSCGAESCTVTQFMGETKFSGSISPGQAGFLVTGLDRRTLAPVERQTFATASGLNEGAGSVGALETAGMASYIKSLAARELMVFVTSVHGPGQAQAVMFTPGTPAATWQSLTEAIATIGGTREGFNTAATTAGSDYTLVGYAGLEEGAGNEIAGTGARLRGALVPNTRSLYEPQGITSGEVAPPELLMKILLRPPQPSAWPLEGNAEATEAIVAIGKQSKLLGEDVRGSYWTQLTSAELAGEAMEDVQRSTLPAKATFSEKAFDEAKAEIEIELRAVKKTRTYMKELAQPANQAGKIGWQEAGLISKELEERLKQLKEEGQAKAEYFSIAAELLELLSLGGAQVKAFKLAAKFAAAAAIAAEAGQTSFEGHYTGAAKAPGLEVQALQLGKQLRIQAEASEAAFARMGDVFVSDWTKLREVGVYGGCNPLDGTCGSYDELSQNEESETISAAAVKRSFDRVIYERLVPLAFPIWNTGTTKNQEATVPPREFECTDFSYPFAGAPPLSYHRSLWEFNPVTQVKTWRIYLSVARSERAYGWAPESMLQRMFVPVPIENSNAEAGGLGVDPGAFMRRGLKINEYSTIWECGRTPAPPEPE